jgi:heat shock protein HslJ
MRRMDTQRHHTAGRRRRAAAALAIAATAALAACAKPDPSRPGATLAGTRWQLVTIESMNDRQTIYRVPDPQRYTLSFGRDGRAAFQLDCNQASAPWTGGLGSSGDLKFGDLTMTRAACPPPSLDRTIARGLSDVHEFMITRGQLTMSLRVEGGAYIWAPVPAAP